MILALVGWALVLRGLYWLPPSQDAHLDLDAGASFDLNLSVYLPAVVLTTLLLAALPTVLGGRAAAAAGAATASVTIVFALWVLNRKELTDHLPGLAGSLWYAVGLSTAALLVVCTGEARRVLRTGRPQAEDSWGFRASCDDVTPPALPDS